MGMRKCSEKKVIGSINELKSHAVEKVPENIDLHKHVVDNIHLKCPKCSSAMTRIPEVIDCWFESASMPYAVKHYPFENKEWFKLNYPADFVSEYIAQVRAWYYYMHVLGVLVFNKAPFRNVVVTGNLLASDGTKMSKSKKNFPDPNLTLDKYGSDTLRFYLMSSPLMRAEDANFNEESLKEIYRRVHILLSNVKTFYELFAKNNKNLNSISSKNILDRWVINRINALMINVTNCFEKYNTITACSEIMAFIDDLSTWYVRRSRDRFKEGDKDAQKTLAYVLLNLAKIMAPITPVISEDIYLMLAKSKTELPESVHLNNWPKPGLKPDEKLDEKMRQTRKITSLALEKREKSKIPVRQVLSSVEVTGIKLSKDYLDIIKNEINVKKVVLKPGKKVSVKLSTKITRELLKEGISRDLIRKINDFWKKLNLTISNRIVLYVETSDRLINESVAGFKKEIMNAVQADKLEFKIPENTETSEAEINGVRLRTGIKVITK